MNRELIERLELALNFDFDGKSMHRLLKDCKEALELPKQEPVAYVPMTDDEFQRIASSKSDVMHNGGWELLYTIYGVAVERAVIERLGLVWGEK